MTDKTMSQAAAVLAFCAVSASACSPSAPATAPTILSDSFFSGRAFLDENGNGEIDAGDAPLQDAIFIVQLQGGAEFGALTDASGNAFVTIPGPIAYPVRLVMRAPKDSAYILTGPDSIVQQGSGGEKASFLFTAK